MKKSIVDLKELIRNMQPQLRDQKFYFASVEESSLLSISNIIGNVYAIFREDEGLTIVFNEMALDFIKSLTNSIAGPFALITIGAFTDLVETIGFSASVTKELARNNISVNPFCGYYHDHLFVPYEKRNEAIKSLVALKEE